MEREENDHLSLMNEMNDMNHAPQRKKRGRPDHLLLSCSGSPSRVQY